MEKLIGLLCIISATIFQIVGFFIDIDFGHLEIKLLIFSGIFYIFHIIKILEKKE